MAKKKYREKPQDIYAVQFDGSNLAELKVFAPGLVVTIDEQLYIMADGGHQAIHTTDWLMDDPSIGYISVITDLAFTSRFDKSTVVP